MVRGLLSAICILLAAAATTPVIFGQLALLELEAFIQGFEKSEQSKVTLELVSYSRGYLTSSAISKLSFHDRFDTHLVVEHKLHHGPIALDGSLIRARVNSEVWPEEQEERDHLKNPFALLVLEDPLLGPEIRVTLTGYEFQSPDEELGWSGFTGDFSMDRETQLGTGDFNFGGFRLEEESGLKIVLEPISGEGEFDARQLENPMTRMTVKMEGLEVVTPVAPSFSMGPFEISMEKQPEGDLIGQTLSIKTGKTQVADSELGPFSLKTEAHNLEPKALAKLQELQKKLQENSPQPGGSPASLLQSQEFLAALDQLAEHSPWLQVTEFDMQGPGGNLRLTALAKIDGEVYARMGGPIGLASASTVNVEIRMTEALFDNLMEATKKRSPEAGAVIGESSDALLEALIEAGFLRRDGAELVLRVDYVQGVTKVNDKLFSKPQFEQVMMAAMTGNMAAQQPDDREKSKSKRGPTSIRSIPASPRGPGGSSRELDEMRRQMGL